VVANAPGVDIFSFAAEFKNAVFGRSAVAWSNIVWGVFQ
jgi:hypothetical protein